MTGGPPDIHPDASSAPSAKLSIRHLMVWAACVALYCSAYQSIERVGPPLFPFRNVFFAGNAALLSGTALTGLLLLLVRRRHDLAYPRHGGEWLWSLAGIGAALTLVTDLLCAFAGPQSAPSLLFFPVQMLVLGIAFLYAILRSENARWKAVFVIIPVSLIAITVPISLAAIGSPAATVGRWFVAASVGHTLLVFAAVAVAARIDLRQTQRYPWPHWAGILLVAWQSASAFASCILYLVFS